MEWGLLPNNTTKMPVKKMVGIHKERARELLKLYTARTQITVTDLSRMVGYDTLILNAVKRGRIAAEYEIKILTAFRIAGIDASDMFIEEEADAPQEPQKAPHDANESEDRGSDPDLRKEVQRLRDDLADLRTILNAIREERQRDEEKLLQAISRLTEAQLTQRQIGEEIVSGIILAMGQINIDEPTRSAYAAIRKGLKADIYRAMKGELK